jgi:hypothetical protein
MGLRVVWEAGFDGKKIATRVVVIEFTGKTSAGKPVPKIVCHFCAVQVSAA